MGDLKEAVLWHEDSGRRPMDNGRSNHPGSVSGHQLGEAAHRLVLNNLQLRSGCNGYPNQAHATSSAYAAPGYGPPVPYPDNRYNDCDYDRMMPPQGGYPVPVAQYHHSGPRGVAPTQRALSLWIPSKWAHLPAGPRGPARPGPYHTQSGYGDQQRYQS